MNRKKVIIGVLMAAIFVMVAFVPLANNIPTDKGNTGANSISPQISISKYVTKKSPVAKGNINSNVSNKIAISFSTWYIKNHAQDKLPPISSKTGSMLFREYLNQSIAGKAYIMRLTNIEKSSFNYSNRMAVNSVESILHTGHNVPSKIQTGNSTSYVINIRPDLPGGVTSDSGSWVMVSINYFVYHAPWWLGGWSVTYGQQDNFNELWAGQTAQKQYNNFESYMTLGGLLSGTAASGITAYLVADAIAGTSVGSRAGLVGAIVGGVVAVLMGFAIYKVENAMTQLYESTYANEPSGNKYIWTYMQNDYYYPSVTVAGSLASSIGFYGHLSNGNLVTLWPAIPFVAVGSLTGVVISSYFASYTNYIENKYGDNTWVN